MQHTPVPPFVLNPLSLMSWFPVSAFASAHMAADMIEDFLNMSCRVKDYERAAVDDVSVYDFEAWYTVGHRTMSVRIGLRLLEDQAIYVVQVDCEDRYYAGELLDELTIAMQQQTDNYEKRSIERALHDLQQMLRGTLAVQKLTMAVARLGDADDAHSEWTDTLAQIAVHSLHVLKHGSPARQQLAAEAIRHMDKYFAYRASTGADMIPVLNAITFIIEKGLGLGDFLPMQRLFRVQAAEERPSDQSEPFCLT